MHVDCPLAEKLGYSTVAEAWDLASEDEREADMIVTMTGDMQTTLFVGILPFPTSFAFAFLPNSTAFDQASSFGRIFDVRAQVIARLFSIRKLLGLPI